VGRLEVVPLINTNKKAPKFGAFQVLFGKGQLYNTLVQHGIGDLNESADVGTLDVIHEVTFRTVFNTYAVDTLHDAMQFGVNFFTGPAQSLTVLTHFKTGSGNTTGMGSFTWSVKDLGFQLYID